VIAVEEVGRLLGELWELLGAGWASLAEFHQGDEAFQLPVAFSMLAYFTFAITGALAGLKRGYDIIGVIMLALITAGGGGLIRDGLLISKGPPALLTNARYVVVVAVAVLVTLLFHRYIDPFTRSIAVIDAIGLGAFAVHGVQRSLEGGLSIPASILGGTLTVVGGGLMRDILVREEPLLFKPGQFYALVAIGGCGLYVALTHYRMLRPIQAAVITIGAVFAARILAIRFNWQTTALYRDAASPPGQGEGPSGP
jgi:uncharacterized membrane protein YeiH